MGLTIIWKIPATISANPQISYTINIYTSTNGENGQYQLINSISAGPGNTTNTYTDSGGNPNVNWYYVTYTPAGGTEGPRVLAVIQPGVTEQRLAEQIQSQLPEIIMARIDSNLIDIRKALANALATVNAYSPGTAYDYTNLPARLETCVVVLAMVLLYIEKHLQVAIRDYQYSGTGISFNVDRNSKFVATLQQLSKLINDLLLFSKHDDWPVDPAGLGTEALSVPQARIFSFLFNTAN